MKVLYLSIKSTSYTGGDVIRKRNVLFSRQYFGNDNVSCLFIHNAAFYPINIKYRLADITELCYGFCKILVNIFDRFAINLALHKNKPDIIFVDNSAIRLPGKISEQYKVITFFHNVESSYTQQYFNSSGKISKLEGCFFNDLQKIEKQNAVSSDFCIAINKRDSDEILKIYCRKTDLILPVSLPDKYSHCPAAHSGLPEQYLLFVGSDFFGNTDGLFHFIENCMDSINCKLIIVGKGMEKYRNRYSSNKIVFAGFVEDIDKYYQDAAAVVLPIISGSGMKTKTCEALMYGKKIFGTHEAFEGYNKICEYGCVECSSDIQFIDSINSYLSGNITLYSQEIRNIFQNCYSDEAVYNIFHDFCDKKLKERNL